MPGDGFTVTNAFPSHQQKIFQFNWLCYGNLNPEKLQKAVLEIPSNGIKPTE